MAKVTINFKDVKTGVMAPGAKPAVVKALTFAENSAQDGYNLIWDFEIVDGEWEGWPLRDFISLKKTVLWRAAERFAAFGVDVEGSDLDLEFDKESGLVIKPNLVGKPCILVTSVGEYQNRERTEISDVLPALSRKGISKGSSGAAITLKAPEPEGEELEEEMALDQPSKSVEVSDSEAIRLDNESEETVLPQGRLKLK